MVASLQSQTIVQTYQERFSKVKLNLLFWKPFSNFRQFQEVVSIEHLAGKKEYEIQVSLSINMGF